jgi:hypothetical protein
MGEAVYYMKVKVAEDKVDSIKAFFTEGVNSYEYWQDNRGKTPAEFWSGFNEQFPVVTEYLQSIGLDTEQGDCNNGPAGKLCFGELEDIERLSYDNGVMAYSAEVWHFADWRGIASFLEAQFDATKVKWLSDEHTSFFECLDVDS